MSWKGSRNKGKRPDPDRRARCEHNRKARRRIQVKDEDGKLVQAFSNRHEERAFMKTGRAGGSTK